MEREWRVAHGRSVVLGPRAVIMGILNVTPDSFSDGGLNMALEAALAAAGAMIDEGADIVDVGGESTRPGAEAVDAATEQARVLPVVEALAARGDTLISVDTYREETARRAIAAGAHIVNDVWGLQREPGIAKVAVETGAGLVIMHTGASASAIPTWSSISSPFSGARSRSPRRPASIQGRSCSIPVSVSPRTRTRT